MLGSPHADIDDALKSEVPFPHVQDILLAALLEDGDELFDAAIDAEDVADAG